MIYKPINLKLTAIVKTRTMATWRLAIKNNQGILFAVKAMSMVYKAKFLQQLQRLFTTGSVTLTDNTAMPSLLNQLYQKDWVVYAKAPFAGPHAVIEYLGRYTHKVAVSNHRINTIDSQANTITFTYKDYADGSTQKQMTLNSDEFIRRFAQHILPKGFTKIRTYGYLSNRNRQERINKLLLQMKVPYSARSILI